MILSQSKYVPAAEASCAVDPDELRRLNDEPDSGTPWSEGYNACQHGEPLDSCPYAADTETRDHSEYVTGWWEAWEDRNR